MKIIKEISLEHLDYYFQIIGSTFLNKRFYVETKLGEESLECEFYVVAKVGNNNRYELIDLWLVDEPNYWLNDDEEVKLTDEQKLEIEKKLKQEINDLV